MRPRPTPAASRKPGIPAALRKPAASPAAAPVAAAARPRVAVVLVVPDERLRHALHTRLRAFSSHSTPADVEVHVIADANNPPAKLDDLRILAAVAEIGGNLDDLNAAVANVKLGWSP